MLQLTIYSVCTILFVIFIIVIAYNASEKYRKNRRLKPVLYQQILEEYEIDCPAGKELMTLVETLINQTNTARLVLNAPESDEAKSIRKKGDRTSRFSYCMQCIEENIRFDENSSPATFVHLATIGDSLLWNHQVLNYLQSFAPALKAVTDGINAIFDEEYSEDSFEQIRNLSAAYGMLYKCLNQLAIYCETAKGIAVDKSEMRLLSDLLRGSASPLAVMPKAAKRKLGGAPQDDQVSINITWQIDKILLSEIKAKAEDHYQIWYISEDLRGNYKRVKKGEY